MKKIDDRQLSAYLDGELSVTETEKLESQLSERQLEHLQREKSLEEGIAQKISSGVECPPELWQGILGKVQKSNRKSYVMIFAAVVAAAALIAIVFSMDFNNYGPNVASTVAELKLMSKTEATLDGINNYLLKKNIKLQLLELPAGHHKQEIIGAGTESIAGEEIVTLLFQCCGRPVKIYVLPRDSAAEKQLNGRDSDWEDGIKGQTRMGNYRLAVVSKHGGVDILSSITDA